MLRRCYFVTLLAVVFLTSGQAHPKPAALIDAECRELQATFQNQTPLVFSGPDPWLELDDIPARMPDLAVAYVYSHGADIRWVFLRIVEEDQGWSEDVNYFYRVDGTIEKRVRTLQSAVANILLEETSYYAGGQILKDTTKKHTLFPGRRDPWEFSDPDAPVYWTTDELPFPLDLNVWRTLS